MKQKNILIVCIIFLMIVFVLFFLIKGKIVAGLYPQLGCGIMTSTLEGNRICDCSGFTLSKSKIGGSRSICIGECSNCKCSSYNYTSNKTQWIKC